MSLLLAHARGLISSSWTQHTEARSADGRPVDPWDANAVEWSLLGALVAGYEHVVIAEGQNAALEALVRACALLATVIESDSLPGWNDAPGRTQADVLAALDQAAASPFPSPADDHRPPMN
jgi:hypothetical protein